MYNKLFTKILDSSVWLESDSTRLVWITMIASMRKDGFCGFSAIGNVANTARVSMEAATEAIRVLESPDERNPDQDHEGRRIERVPDGWVVINAQKYNSIISHALEVEKTRIRVREYRERKKAVTPVTESNGFVQKSNDSLDVDVVCSEKSTTNQIFNSLEAAMVYCREFRVTGEFDVRPIEKAI